MTKKIALLLLCVFCGCTILAGCNSREDTTNSDDAADSESNTDNSSDSSSDTGSSTKTLSEYIGSGENVLGYYFRYTDGLAKNTEVYTIYVFKGDRLDLYHGFDMTLTDVASMTDEETIEYCKNNAESISNYPYEIIGLTDDTGNNIDSEVIRIIEDGSDYYIGDIINGFNEIKDYEVYDSVFTAFYFEPRNNPQKEHKYLAFENAPTLTFDTTKSGNILIDPYTID